MTVVLKLLALFAVGLLVGWLVAAAFGDPRHWRVKLHDEWLERHRGRHK